MAGRWAPTDSIGGNEPIGRRLFDGPRRLIGADDQQRPARLLEITHFEEKRDEGRVSFDRLGKSGAEKSVLSYLKPRAVAAAQAMRPPRIFSGWAVARAKNIAAPRKGPRLALVSSPMREQLGIPGSENDYHAHAERPPNYGVYEMANHLQHIFESELTIENVMPPTGWQLTMYWAKWAFWSARGWLPW
jgi:hypothetical protein